MTKHLFTDDDIRDVIISAYSGNIEFGDLDKTYLKGYNDALKFVAEMTYGHFDD